jgi:hypothetical protein
MTSLRQIDANRRNAQLSTGPETEEGKQRSRQNALRHGLTAVTVINAMEDAEDYASFQLAVASDYDAQTAVERELVLRLASVLWRLRRASAIETGLFEMQARQLLRFRRCHPEGPTDEQSNPERQGGVECAVQSENVTASFLRLSKLPTAPLDRLSRYEAGLWRQACQILFTLQCSCGRIGLTRKRFR